jgi:hypothetical protein
MTPEEEAAAIVKASESITALRRMPLAARARIESESDALLMLLARARRIAGSDAEVEDAIRMTEKRVARIQSGLIAARMQLSASGLGRRAPRSRRPVCMTGLCEIEGQQRVDCTQWRSAASGKHRFKARFSAMNPGMRPACPDPRRTSEPAESG